MNPPQHITYFSEATLTKLLASCGLETLEVKRVGKKVSLGLFLFILRYLTRHKIDLSRIGSRLANRSIYLNLFDVMLVRARKA